jgi:hypothetical protein
MMCKLNIFILVICLLTVVSAGEMHAEGLSSLSKNTVIQRTNPDYQDFVKQYLDLSNRYSSKGCFEYGKKTNQSNAADVYCEMYFRDDYGLTSTPASFIREKANKSKFAEDLVTTMYQYLTESKKYDIKGCYQIMKDKVYNRMGRRKTLRNEPDFQEKEQGTYKEADEICEKFFLP